MKPNVMKTIPLIIALLTAGIIPAWAQNPELDQLKATMQQMQKTMEEMQKKIAELEKEKAAAPSATNGIERNSPSYQTLEKVAAGQDVGKASPVQDRHSFNDQQEGAHHDWGADPTIRSQAAVLSGESIGAGLDPGIRRAGNYSNRRTSPSLSPGPPRWAM